MSSDPLMKPGPFRHSIYLSIPTTALKKGACTFTQFKKNPYSQSLQKMLHCMIQIALESTEKKENQQIHVLKEELYEYGTEDIGAFRLWFCWNALWDDAELHTLVECYVGIMQWIHLSKTLTQDEEDEEEEEGKKKTISMKSSMQSSTIPYITSKTDLQSVLNQLIPVQNPSVKRIEAFLSPHRQFDIVTSDAVGGYQRSLVYYTTTDQQITFNMQSHIYVYTKEDLVDFWNTSILL